MKKQRIGVYNKKVIVAGDKNLAGPNELHISKVNGGENSGGGSDKIEYFKLREPIKDLGAPFNYIMSTVAFENGPVKGIIPHGAFGLGFYYNTILGFAFCGFAINTDEGYRKFASVKEYLIGLIEGEFNGEPIPNDILDTIYEEFGLIPITKEEYYNLIK